MKLLKEYHEEFCHTRALDNVLKWDVRGNGTVNWVHMAKQPLDVRARFNKRCKEGARNR